MTAASPDQTTNPTTGDAATNPDPAETSAAAAGDDGLLTRVALDALAPHPDNPRGDRLGDLTELVRSIKAQGVLEPLIVLPADEQGVHRVVAGHRRLAAARTAGATRLPVVIRPLSPTEVVETFLVENGQRADLPPSAEVTAIERLLSLDPRLTPTRLSRRIGRSQAWCRTRMALTVLPDAVRQALDAGELTVAAASAVASVADLGAEHMTALAASLTGRSWGDEQRMADHYRQQLQRDTAWRQRLDAARQRRHPVHDSEPRGSARLDRLFADPKDRAHHAREDCHALVIRPLSWGAGYDEYTVCTSPRRHQHHDPAAARTASTSPDAARRLRERDDQHARRQGRKARLAAGAELFTRPKGGPKAASLAQVAMLTLIAEAGQEPLKHAAVLLGIDPKTERLSHVLARRAATSAADLARVAGAVALGHAEERSYWSPRSPAVQGWVAILTEHGWDPDPWTRGHILTTTGQHGGGPVEADGDAACSDFDSDGARTQPDGDDAA